VSFGVGPEAAARLALLGHLLPQWSLPVEDRGATVDVEASDAYQTKLRAKVAAGAALARRATAEAEATAAKAVAAWFAAAAAGESSLGGALEPPLHGRLPPHNRTAADVWVLDRQPTWEALPASLRLEDLRREAKNFRRLHPAMLQNVWDVQRLVTGLLHTPAFLRPHSANKHGHPSHDRQHAHEHRGERHRRDESGGEGTRPGLSARDDTKWKAAALEELLKAPLLEAAAPTAREVKTATGQSRSANTASAVPIAELEAVVPQGYGYRDDDAGAGSLESATTAATALRHPFCTCGATLTMKNAHLCAAPQPITDKSTERARGYPLKGRLGHWAAPCDYDAGVLGS
jgi:hypothetical protein